MIPELYHPVLDCFLRGLPYAYRRVDALLGTVVQVEVSGDCGGVWQIQKEQESWVSASRQAAWNARVIIPQEIAWRMFTRGIARQDALKQVSSEGDRALGLTVMELTAIVA